MEALDGSMGAVSDSGAFHTLVGAKRVDAPAVAATDLGGTGEDGTGARTEGATPPAAGAPVTAVGVPVTATWPASATAARDGRTSARHTLVVTALSATNRPARRISRPPA